MSVNDTHTHTWRARCCVVVMMLRCWDTVGLPGLSSRPRHQNMLELKAILTAKLQEFLTEMFRM